MFRVNYKRIVAAYESTNYSLLEEFGYSRANEASTEEMVQGTTPNQIDQTLTHDQPTTSANLKTKLIDKVKKNTEEIQTMIAKAKTFINNRLKLLTETDKGFLKNLEARRNTNKPLQSFNAIIYQYNDNYLERTMKLVIGELIKIIQELQNGKIDQSDEGLDATALIQRAVDKGSRESHDIPAFTNEVIKRYRGDKIEMTLRAGQIPELMKTVTSGVRTDAFYNYIKDIEGAFNNLKSQQAKLSAGSTNEELRRNSKKMTVISQMYNAAVSMAKIYYELKIERYLSAREIMKKFYNM